MARMKVPVTLLCLLHLASGCDRQKVPASNANIIELRRAFYSYLIGGGHDPIDTPENMARILALLKTIEPLDCPEKTNVALDIFEYYDATDNAAQEYAREMLVKYGKATLPFVRDRLRSAPNPEDMRNLIRDIQGS